MKKTPQLLLGFVVLLIFCVTAASGAESRPGPITVPIRSAAETEYPPFSIIDANGRADGFSVELFRAALAAMGREVDFRIGPWAEVRGLLEKGEIEALPLVGRTPEREHLFDFTFPYMSLHGAIVVRTGTSDIRTVSDLQGKQVAVMSGDNAEEFLRRTASGVRIVATQNFDEALAQLSQGMHDAVVIQHLVGLRLLQEGSYNNLEIVKNPIKEFRQDFCFAVQEGDRKTLALLNEGLALVMADGTYHRLHAKWFAALQLPADRSIIVGGDHDYPPFEFLDEKGRPTGFTVELTRAIAQEMNIPVQIRLGPWLETYESLRNGEIDAIQGIFYSTERHRVFDFAPFHLVSHFVSVTRKESGLPPEDLSDLGGKSLVVQQGDVILDFLKEKGLYDQVTIMENQKQVLEAVATGTHDCAILPRINSLYLAEKYGFTNLITSHNSFLPGEYSYAVAKGNSALLAQFSEGLRILRDNGEYRRIRDKWMGLYDKPSLDLATILGYLAMVALPLLALLVTFMLWSWLLRRQVAKKTSELQESVDRFKYVFEAANVGKSLTLPSGKLHANQALAEMLGYNQEELDGKSWQELTPKEDIEPTTAQIAPLLAGEADRTRFEKRYVHRSGTQVWADVSTVVRRDDHGSPLYFVTTVIDITAKKRAESALRKSEEFQRAMIGCSPVALYSVDLHGLVTTWNNAAERILGWVADEVIGKPLPTIPEGEESEITSLLQQVSTGKSFFGLEVVRAHKVGTLINGSLSLSPIRDSCGTIVGVMGAMEDISERKREQERIDHLNRVLHTIRNINQLIIRERDSETLIRESCRRLVVNRGYLSAMIVLTDYEGRPVSWAMEGLAAGCAEMSELFEKGTLPSCCDVAGKLQETLLVDERQTVCGICPLALAIDYGDNQSFCSPLSYSGKTYGYIIAASIKSLPVSTEEYELFSETAADLAFALNVLEIEAEQKHSIAALQQSEARFRLFAELAPVGIVIADNHEKTLFASSKFTELFGYTLEDMPSIEEWWQLAYPDKDLSEQVRQEWQATMASALTNQSVSPSEYPVTCKDGNVRQIEFRLATTDNLNIIVFIDVTERKRAREEREELQSQLYQANKMESIGQLAGGVAHDYNNMLSVIIGFTELAKIKVGPKSPINEDLQEVLTAARRASEITRQLLAFARKQAIRPKVLDLNDAVEQMLKMLRRLIGEQINLGWQPENGLWPVYIDPSQLDQILANLCVNARDAIACIGEVTIWTRNVHLDENYFVTNPSTVPGAYTLLAISDNGCGINQENREKIFEPFFTTKELGKGTGLGLATVFGIVKQNNGYIDVYSEPGIGSTFKIYLPRYLDAAESTEKSAKLDIPHGQGETVLIVEDETSLLKIVGRSLTNLGYNVLTTTSPKHALQIVWEKHRKIDLLITDVVMPEMNGGELSEKMQALYPGIEVLFMSGYAADFIAQQRVLEAEFHFLEKPFGQNELAQKVREVLESSASGAKNSADL